MGIMASKESDKPRTLNNLTKELVCAVRARDLRKVDWILQGKDHSLSVEEIVNNVVEQRGTTTKPQGRRRHFVIENTENCDIDDTLGNGLEKTTALIEVLKIKDHGIWVFFLQICIIAETDF